MKHIDTERHLIRSARKKFIAMAGTYCLGVFNDNYFKQAVMLVAVSAGLSHLQGFAAVLFALPFILFSSYAGWLSDRFPKKKVVIGSKGLEVVAMLIGATGLILGNWACVLAMVFLMGAQSAFFSPALNGSIPELYPPSYIPRANAVIKLVTTLAVLAGIALSGISLDQKWFAVENVSFGHLLVSAVVVGIAVFGFVASFGVYSKQTSNERLAFPRLGPVHSVRDLCDICRDKQLRLGIIADSFFYFLASIAVLTINVLGLEQFGFSQTVTSMMSMSLMVGVALGSLLAARWMSIERWSRFLVVSALGMGGGLFLSGIVSYIPEGARFWWLAGTLTATGMAGGMFLIPVTSFLQVRPAAESRGRVLATANFCGFVAILLSGFLFNLLNALFAPSTLFLLMAIASVLAAYIFYWLQQTRTKFGRPLLSFIGKKILSLRYKVTVKGMEDLQLDLDKGVLFLPNHPALIDPVIVMTTLLEKYNPRPLSDADQAAKPLVRRIMRLVRPITLPSLHTNGRRGHKEVKEALNTVVGCLNKGEQVILYPAGRLYRSAKEELAANSAVETVIRNVPDVQIVLVRTTGLWGSSFSFAEGTPSAVKYLRRYIFALITGGLFFTPKRKVTVELVKDDEITSLTGRRGINEHLESFYNRIKEQNTSFPYYWWQGRSPRLLPEPEQQNFAGNPEKVSPVVRKQVLEQMSLITGQDVKGGEDLANDLGVDSLTLMECISWLENEFGVAVDDSSAILTVDDCILAASGQLFGPLDNSLIQDTAGSWFTNDSKALVFENGSTINDCFLKQFVKNPKRTLFADQLSGCKSNRDIVAAVFVLKPLIEKLNGPNVGIMLPPSVSASIVYLATLFSGKTPVMFNWTSGVGNMDHGIQVTETKTILTARKLYDRIEEQQGVDLSELPIEWCFLDDVASTTSLNSKVKALVKARLGWRTLKNVKVSDTAAILFTSGSESKPKAVPLSHNNILTNMEDFSGLISFKPDEKLLGMLPPFHSLGLVGTTILPLCTGLKTVYHNNPTESVTLARIIDSYKVTMTIGTPTFLDGILQAGSKEQLETLRLVFTGAEKCPQHVYNRLGEVLPEAVLCEGYGVTECSPLVSINVPDNVKEGTIGAILPSVEYVIIHPETGTRVKTGEKGLLLVRGKSVFNGYLGLSAGKGFRELDGMLWYDTGDYVRENSDATINFCGRQKRFVKLGGEMVSLPAIESVLLEEYNNEDAQGPNLAIEASAALGHPEIVLFSTFEIEREVVNKVIRNRGLSPLHNIRRIENVGEIPVLGSGKTDYQTLKKMIAA